MTGGPGSHAGFAVLAIPGNEQPLYATGEFQRINLAATDLAALDGMLFCDFTSENCYFLPMEEAKPIATGELTGLSALFSEADPEIPENYVISKENYLKELKTLQDLMKVEGVQKVVYSRTDHLEYRINIAGTLQKLILQYPHCLCYLVYSPDFGMWMGATPEKLMDETGGHLEIHALAGTMPAEHINWSQKEFEEQQLVVDYIEQQLSDCGIKGYEVIPRTTVINGPVAHLKTVFRLDRSLCPLSRLIKKLHPTPAVCGFPKASAMGLILDTEQHNRGFYTGFLGTLGPRLDCHLYVNLRCMQFNREEVFLFAGGGITAASDPEKEWDETELKLLTVKRALVPDNSGS